MLLGIALAGPARAQEPRPADAPTGAVRADEAGREDASTVTLRSAQVLTLPAPTPAPPADGVYAPVSLPDDWTLASTPGLQAVWYRLEFERPVAAGDGPLAAYVPRVCFNLELHLNGVLLHRGGRMTEPVTRNCYHAQLVALPASLLREGVNRLDLQVVGFPLPRVAARQRAGGLSEVLVGPQELLREAYESALFWNVTVPQAIAATLLLIGFVMIGLSWVRRLRYLLYFGLAAAGWALLSVRLWWRDIPLPHGSLELLTAAAFVPVAVCALLFVLRYCDVRRRALDVLLWGQCLAMPAALWLAGPERLFVAASTVYAILAVEVALAVGFYLMHAWRHRRAEFWFMGFISLCGAVAVAVEVAVQGQLVPLESVHVMHFALPVLFVALGFRLVQRFAQALDAAESARLQLEHRVREISADIERNFAHLAEIRVEQVAEKERKRIAADLHDDLGAKLLTIVHTSTDERISTLAREALEEMRLSVRGIAGKPVQLTDALADWRAEVVSRLGEAGVEVDWQSLDPEEPRTLPARSYVQTTRVLREATSNLIKHSGATRAIYQCSVGDDFQLVIRDNGRGIPLELDGKLDRGHGMASMKARAKQMQGQCLVESGPGYGTVIRLTLPL